jgi:multiple antibiotic resistance protein
MLLDIFLSSFVTFFVVIDPPAMAPMFVTMTEGMSPAWRRRMAWKGLAVAIAVLLAFAFGGAWLLAQLHVTLDAFRVAGGLLLFLIGVDMLFEKRSERREQRADRIAAGHAAHPEIEDDISVFPLAIPLITGPGAIASIMLFFTQHAGAAERGAILAGAGANFLLCLIAFLAAGPIARLIGATMAAVVTRIFGILLCALASQFVIDGVRGAFDVGA